MLPAAEIDRRATELLQELARPKHLDLMAFIDEEIARTRRLIDALPPSERYDHINLLGRIEGLLIVKCQLLADFIGELT